MLKFFRRIRQQLIDEGRLTSYIFYAIGEILLVMIGILLALQVNNWNNQRSDRQLEKSILMEMRENLKVTLRDIRYNLNFDSTNKAATEIVLYQLENKLPYTDSLKSYYGKMGVHTVIMENSAAYQNLKSLGLHIISNDKLRTDITYFYSGRMEYSQEVIETIERFVLSTFQPALLEHTRSKTNEFYMRFPADNDALIENEKFKETLRLDIMFKQIMIDINKRTEKQILDLMEGIDKEIRL